MVMATETTMEDPLKECPSDETPVADIPTARSVVQSILQQITIEDSPPMNDDAALRSPRTKPERKLGHMALANLCRQTLEATLMEEDEVVQLKHRPRLTLDLGIINNDNSNGGDKENDETLAKEHTPKSRDPPARRAGSQDTTLVQSNGLILGLPPTPKSLVQEGYDHATSIHPPPDPTPTAHDALPSVPSADETEALTHEEPFDDDDDEDTIRVHTFFPVRTSLPELPSKVIHRHDPVYEQRVENLLRGPRLQMFGSEYARFLSETPLAPTPHKAKLVVDRAQQSMLQDAAVASGAITDILVTTGNTLPIKGYYRIATFKNPQQSQHLYVKKEPNWDRAVQRPCVTALAVIFPDRHEIVPPGFCVVSHYQTFTSKGAPANLGVTEPIYLCYRRSREGNPLTGLLPLSPPEPIPEGYTVLEKSPRNHVADLGNVFIAYRQRIASLETMRPLPLLLAVYHQQSRKHWTAQSYYCTGGTTVFSKIGKYHIMDRSTHSLVSPSSVKNRLSLINAARIKNGSSDSSTAASSSIFPGLSSLDSMNHSLSLNTSFQTIPEEGGVLHQDGSSDGSSVIANSSVVERSYKIVTTLFTEQDASLNNCLGALSFIPVVESLSQNEADLRMRIAILTPILTACYTQHGGASLLAVQGLTRLLQEASFFDADVVPTVGSDSRLTLLDLAIQSVCDLATSSARETIFDQCIEFVKEAVKHSGGRLNSRTIGYVLRFYLFIFYFGASIPTSSSSANTVWSVPNHYRRGNCSEVAKDDIPFLFEPDEHSGYLPGGAPQAAVLAMKELMFLLMSRISQLSGQERDQVVEEVKESATGDSSVFDDGSRVVALSDYTQLALHQIHRSGGSELFWYDMMMSCGSGLFGGIGGMTPEDKQVHIIVFSMLANLVKISSGMVRRAPNTGALIPRDVASKLLSLELLHCFLGSFRRTLDGLETSWKEATETMVYSTRRLVATCLLNNTLQSLQDPRVFRRVMGIISELWQSPIFRRHMKVELGVLIDQYLIRLLGLGPQLLIPGKMHSLLPSEDEKLFNGSELFVKPIFNQQIDLLFEVSQWFRKDARGLIDFFLNFDTDISHYNEIPNHWMPGSQSKLCERLCNSVCSIAEQCGDIINDQIKESHLTNEGPLTPTGISSNDNATKLPHRRGRGHHDSKDEKADEGTAIRLGARQLQKAAFVAASQIARSIAVAAATSSGRDVSKIVAREPRFEMADSFGLEEDHVCGSRPGDDTILSYWRTAIAADRRVRPPRRPGKAELETPLASGNSTRRVNSDDFAAAGDNTATFVAEGSTDDNLRKAFRIAAKKSLKKAIDYLITNRCISPSARDVATFLRVHHNKINMKCLGEYLGEGGVKDDEIEYFNSVRFHYVRAISFVGMTVEQGLRHFLTSCGFRLPGEAQRIDRIITTFSQCYWEDNAGDYYRCPFDNQGTVFLLSFAIIMLNTDLHKVSHQGSKLRSRRMQKKMTKPEFLNNLRGVAKDDELSQDYLSTIYDSVEARPIELFEDSNLPVLEIKTSNSFIEVSTQKDLGKLLKSIVKNVKKSEELLRGLSVHDFCFYTIEDYGDYMSCSKREALVDLTHSAFSSTWRFFHELIKTTVKNAHLDPQALLLSLELLTHCLCTAICLDMSKELEFFLQLLASFKMIAEKSTIPVTTRQVREWFSDLRSALADVDRVSALEQVMELTDELEERLKLDSEVRNKIILIVRKIRDGQFLLHDPMRYFMKEGTLVKRSHRLSRSSSKYQFFLFSDLLLYCKLANIEGTEFIIQETFALHLMKIVDWYPNSNKSDKNFTVHHPRKSFTVVCSTVKERKEWVGALRHAINEALRRASMLAQMKKSDHTSG